MALDLSAHIGALAVPDQTMSSEDLPQIKIGKFGLQSARHDEQIRLAVEWEALDIVQIVHRIAGDRRIDHASHQRFRMRVGKTRPCGQAQRDRARHELLDEMRADRAGVGIDEAEPQINPFRLFRRERGAR